MDKAMKIAVLLTAVDQMSGVVDSAVNKSTSMLQKLQPAIQKATEGFLMIGAGKAGLDFLGKATDAYGDMQESANKMKMSMLQSGGVLDSGMYQKLYKQSEAWSEKYANTAASYMDMVRVMKANKISEKDILGGAGEAVAQLADLFDNMPPAQIAQFAARMKNDIGIPAAQMVQMTDLVQRLHNLGVGSTGAEAVNEMNEFFSKVGLGMANLKMQGIDAGKQMGLLGAIFIRRGISGQSVGTNFRRILDGIRDPERLQKAQATAAQYGKTLDLFDKQGNFKGMGNFVQQINQLSSLDPQSVSKILNAFGGRQGLSTDFLEYLANYGLKDFADMGNQYSKQANQAEKLSVAMTGLNYQKKVFNTSWTNTKAAFGEAMAPALTGFYNLLNKVVVGIRKFTEQHPMISKFAAVLISAVSAGLMIMGLVKVFQAVTIAMRIMGIAAMINPLILIISVIAAGALLLMTNWSGVAKWWKNMWAGIKNSVSSAWNWIKNAFLNFTPLGIIMKNWDPAKGFFANMWTGIKAVFHTALTWIGNLASKFYNAGKNIIKSIWEGIKAVVMWPIDEIKKMAQKIRDYLPFSPAKTGALKDIHKIKLIETIAASIKPDSLVHAMNKTMGAVFNSANQPAPAFAGRAASYNFKGGDIIIHGNTDKNTVEQIKQMQRTEFERMYKDMEARNKRVKF